MYAKALTFLIVTILLLSMGSCKKDSLPDGRFIGTWIAVDKTDTLNFIDDQTFKSPGGDGLQHTFVYSYSEDSITIQYAGPNFVLVRPSTHHYMLTRSTLIIDLYKVNYGFDPVKKEYIKSEK
jgi:hypothetical protein